MNVCFHYHFHPVGQGLFASGCLYEANHAQPRFLWVYDCGTVTKGIHWQGLFGELQRFARGKDEIDLLTISHFDNDHIRGVVPLLQQFRVKTLLLPYMPLWERLLVAFQEQVGAEDPLMGFYLDPVAYLRGIDGAEIERVLIVEQGEEGDEAVEEIPNPEDWPTEGEWKAMVRSKRPESGKSEDDASSGIQASDPLLENENVELLRSGEVILIQGLWEFVPYNAPRPPVSSQFEIKVRNLRGKLLSASDEAGRNDALKALKSTYDKEFGAGSEARNRISLFLYSGPVYSSWVETKMLSGKACARTRFPLRYPCYYRVHPDAPGILAGKCSLLYSGDGYLSEAEEFDDLSRMLGRGRMTCLGVFQVNHHGAEGNWHQGLAKKLSPGFSIFSSDPMRGRTYHPDAVVLRDFWPYLPVQVNRSGFSVHGWLVR
jgi:hypothetical protein